MKTFVVSWAAAFWGGLISAAAHAYPHPGPGVVGALGVLAAYAWGALVVGVGTWLLIRIACGFAATSHTGRQVQRLTEPDADLDTVLRFGRGQR